MLLTLIQNLLVPIFVGGFSSTFVSLIFKNYVEKGIEHKFNVKLEDYKAELEKRGVGYGIEMSEFSKKKFDYILQLYTKVLELQTRYLSLLEDLSEKFTTVDDVTENFELNKQFLRRVLDINKLSSLFIDKSATNAVQDFCNLNFHIFVYAAEIYKYEVAQKFENQRQFINYTNATNERHKEECQKYIKQYDELLEKVRLQLGHILKID